MVFNKLRSLLSYSRIPLRIATIRPRPAVFRVRIRSQEKGSLFWTSFGIFSLTLGFKLTTGSPGEKGEEQVYFLPMSLPKPVAQQPFAKDDPIHKVYRKFLADRKRREQVTAKLLESALKAMEKQERFGKGMRCDSHWLWFNFPAAPPPEYTQSGLAVSRAGIYWTTRPMPYRAYHRLMNYIWPSWMLNGLVSSLYRIRKKVREEIAKPIEEDPDMQSTVHIAIPHPFFAGKLAFEDVDNFRNDLIKTIKYTPPPPKGHIRIDGVLQLSTETYIIHADVEATFNPEDLKDLKLIHMKVRHMALAKRKDKSSATMRKVLPPGAAAIASPMKAENILSDAKQIVGKIRLQDVDNVASAVSTVDAPSSDGSTNSTAHPITKSEEHRQIPEKKGAHAFNGDVSNSKKSDVITPSPSDQPEVKPKPRPKEEQ